MEIQDGKLAGAELSKVRTILFWGLALVWFCEMLFLGVPSFNRVWIDAWHVPPPEDPQLSLASMITGAVGAPVKAAFFVMAVIAIRSKNPSTRTALFVSMSLVPPLNLAFPFQYQGFLLKPVMIASILSTILWVSFFVFKEPHRQSEKEVKENIAQSSGSKGSLFQYSLFSITSILLTALAFLFLFFPKMALKVCFPCMPDILNSSQADLSGMIYHSMATGTHLLAFSVGAWIATVNCRRNSTLRKAMAFACIVFLALFFIFPIRHFIVAFGVNCMPLFVLYVFSLILVCWIIYAAFPAKTKFKATQFINTN